MSWVVLIWNALMVVAIVAGVASAHNGQNCGGLSQQACSDATTAGAAIGVTIIVVIWLVGDVLLGILWLVTKGNRRACPACGLPVKAGKLKCKKCGFDFRAIAPAMAVTATAPPTKVPIASPVVPAGWFPDPYVPGQLRYWNGVQWTDDTQASPSPQ
jgi:hypothetical protein